MPLPAISPGGLPAAGPPRRCRRHQPETTLLYPLVEQYYPAFLAHLKAEGRTLPDYVQREFTDFLKCGQLEHGFLRVRCESCHREKLVTFSCRRRGFRPSCGARRMVESASPAGGQGREVVPSHHPSRSRRAAPVTYPRGQGTLRAEDPIPQWHYPCDLRTAGFYSQTRGSGTQAESQSDKISSGIRTQQQTPRDDHPSRAGQGK